MLPFESLREALTTEALAASAAAGVKVLLVDVPRKPPPKEAWCEFFHSLGVVQPATGYEENLEMRCPGVVIFNFYAPENTDRGAITRAANVIVRYWSSRQISVPPDGCVYMDKLVVTTRRSRFNTPFIAEARGEFYYFYKDKDDTC